ncbi:hypothetical protein C8F04DRAFT_1192831 [Mycena alexandri]|uniref:Uncharacterized protein n=1 Tax=Mycena alexandri TaxID=1745969 RepID=A0AAD6S9X3_9AGAR|nr:hypothetical protein C8F04DRAFT_1192831 [Mycena alexandri]
MKTQITQLATGVWTYRKQNRGRWGEVEGTFIGTQWSGKAQEMVIPPGARCARIKTPGWNECEHDANTAAQTEKKGKASEKFVRSESTFSHIQRTQLLGSGEVHCDCGKGGTGKESPTPICSTYYVSNTGIQTQESQLIVAKNINPNPESKGFRGTTSSLRSEGYFSVTPEWYPASNNPHVVTARERPTRDVVTGRTNDERTTHLDKSRPASRMLTCKKENSVP